MRLYNFNKFNESKEDIESICRKWSIRNWHIQDGLINVDGSVDLSHQSMLKQREMIKLPVDFGEITQNFLCYSNELITLEGAPKKVNGNFDCSWNELTTLEGSPQKVGGYFYCYRNKLTSLEGCPQKVGGNFLCYFNQLTTLVGGPEEVLGNYYCYDNQLIDVRGFPEYYRGGVLIYGNPVHQIIKLFEGVDIDIIIETLNDYNVIRKGKVDLQLLKYAFDALEIPMPKIKYIQGYEII